MKIQVSLFTKIFAWFILNLLIITASVFISLNYKESLNIQAMFGRQIFDRLRTTAMLISHDLVISDQQNWQSVLERHSKIYNIDFVLLLPDGTSVMTDEITIPDEILKRSVNLLNSSIIPGSENRKFLSAHQSEIKEKDIRPHIMLKSEDPKLHWTGLKIPLEPPSPKIPKSGLLLVVSDSFSGNGFFFDLSPLIITMVLIVAVSIIFWIPMVRNITVPLRKMTETTENIANGNFDNIISGSRNDEIGRLSKAINHMSSRLSAYVTDQKRFMGDVAHELGSPIARIQFGLSALEQRVKPENRERVTDIIDDIDHMSKLVSELLAFSRADISAESVQLERIDLLPVIRNAARREAGPDSSIAIDIAPEQKVLASGELLTRAVANLIRNSLKYAGKNGVIRISAVNRGGMVDIEVKDNGSGVPEEVISKIFEPFFRPEESRDRDSGGVGLGLAIVAACVKTCRGSVTARNLKPLGFAVTISLREK